LRERLASSEQKLAQSRETGAQEKVTTALEGTLVKLQEKISWAQAELDELNPGQVAQAIREPATNGATPPKADSKGAQARDKTRDDLPKQTQPAQITADAGATAHDENSQKDAAIAPRAKDSDQPTPGEKPADKAAVAEAAVPRAPKPAAIEPTVSAPEPTRQSVRKKRAGAEKAMTGVERAIAAASGGGKAPAAASPIQDSAPSVPRRKFSENRQTVAQRLSVMKIKLADAERLGSEDVAQLRGTVQELDELLRKIMSDQDEREG
jgi:hypothetical protein